MKNIILFDLDGTLIDSTEAILESFNKAYEHFDRETPSEESIKALIGHPLDVMFYELGIDEDEKWNYVDVYKLHYREISREKTELLPFAKEAIQEAASFARLGIVTTKTGKYSRELMEHFDLMHYFETLIGRENVENPKPHAEPINKALEEISVSKGDNVWMLGDTWMDIQSAHNAGVKSVALLSGYDRLETLCKYTDIIKDNALEAVKYIKQSG